MGEVVVESLLLEGKTGLGDKGRALALHVEEL
jgi:hypothetical protein